MEPLAIISDIHANFYALKAVLEDIDKNGISEIICLGDLVGYGSMPNECVTEIRKRDIECLLGNHDSYLIGESNCERSQTVAEIISRHKKDVSEENKNWLSSLPSSSLHADKLFVHGGPKDTLDQYVYNFSSDLIEDLPPEIKFLICGHTHVQATFKHRDFTFINPGSVGQPRDGDSRAAYAVLINGQVILRRVVYNIRAAIQHASDNGYPSHCVSNLNKGTQIGGRIDTISCGFSLCE